MGRGVEALVCSDSGSGDNDAIYNTYTFAALPQVGHTVCIVPTGEQRGKVFRVTRVRHYVFEEGVEVPYPPTVYVVPDSDIER